MNADNTTVMIRSLDIQEQFASIQLWVASTTLRASGRKVWVEDVSVVELKCVEGLGNEHTAQCYVLALVADCKRSLGRGMNAPEIESGVFIRFGGP